MAKKPARIESRQPCASREHAEGRVSKPRRRHGYQAQSFRQPRARPSFLSLAQIVDILGNADPARWTATIQNDKGQMFTALSASSELNERTSVSRSSNTEAGLRSLSDVGINDFSGRYTNTARNRMGKPLHGQGLSLSNFHKQSSLRHPVKIETIQRSLSEDENCVKDEETEDEDPDDAGEESDDEFPGAAWQRFPIKVEEISAKYRDIFKLLKQKGCKKVLQAWLKKCHPKKQGNFPYNGGTNAKDQSDYDQKNKGKHTAPPYWPSQDNWQKPHGTGCRHREPDHQLMNERLNLLCHLLRVGARNVSEGFDFSVPILMDSTKDVVEQHPEHFQSHAQEVLQDIYDCRIMEQRFQANEIDGDTIVWVSAPVRNTTIQSQASLPCNKDLAARGAPSAAKEVCPESHTSSSMSSPHFIKQEVSDPMDMGDDNEAVAYDMEKDQGSVLPMHSTSDGSDAASTNGTIAPATLTKSNATQGFLLGGHCSFIDSTSCGLPPQDMQYKVSTPNISQKSSFSNTGSDLPTESALTSDMLVAHNQQMFASAVPCHSNQSHLQEGSSCSPSEFALPWYSSNYLNPGEHLVTRTLRSKVKPTANRCPPHAIATISGTDSSSFDLPKQSMSRDQNSAFPDVHPGTSANPSIFSVNVCSTADASYTMENPDWFATMWDGEDYWRNASLYSMSDNSSLETNFTSTSNCSQNPPMSLDDRAMGMQNGVSESFN